MRSLCQGQPAQVSDSPNPAWSSTYTAAGFDPVDGASRVKALRHARTADADVVSIDLVDGRTVSLAVADDADAGREHKVTIDGRAVSWKGHFGRFDTPAAGAGARP